MSSNKVLCTCFKCKKKGSNNIGYYVHPTTKWRHVKNIKKKYNLSLNELSDDDAEVKFNRLIVLNKLIYLIIIITVINKSLCFIFSHDDDLWNESNDEELSTAAAKMIID